MRRKRRIATQEVYKWKARLNFDGSWQTKGVHYWETYAPVASWSTIWLLLTLSTIKQWPAKQIGFVMAYTQVEAETDKLFMEIPKGYDLKGAAHDHFVLRLKEKPLWSEAGGQSVESASYKEIM